MKFSTGSSESNRILLPTRCESFQCNSPGVTLRNLLRVSNVIHIYNVIFASNVKLADYIDTKPRAQNFYFLDQFDLQIK